jgi:hypothetical protein
LAACSAWPGPGRGERGLSATSELKVVSVRLRLRLRLRGRTQAASAAVCQCPSHCLAQAMRCGLSVTVCFAVSHSPPLASRPFRLLKSVSLHHPSQSPLRLGVSLRDSVRHPGEPESRSLPVAGWVQAPSPGRRPSGSQARTRCNQELLLPADAGPHNSKQLEPPTVLRLA